MFLRRRALKETKCNPRICPVRSLITSITDAFSSRYDVPDSNPLVSIIMDRGVRGAEIAPSDTILAIIGGLPHICQEPSERAYPLLHSYAYHSILVTLRNPLSHCGNFTFGNACTTMVGLAEYLYSREAFYECSLQIFVDGCRRGLGNVDDVRMSQSNNSTAYAAKQE